MAQRTETGENVTASNDLTVPQRFPGTRLLVLVLTLFAALMVTAPSAMAAQQVIDNPPGPLTKIYLNDNLGCQGEHTGDTAPEFFGGTNPGACGTFLSTGGTSYGPNVPAGNSRTQYTPVSQTAVTGTGTAADPFQVVTVVDVAATGLRITQTDSYIVGQENYRSDIVVTNTTAAPIDASLYHAADCFLQNSDAGLGFADASTGGIYCSKTANNSPPDRIEGFVPLSGGSHYFEDGFSTVWGAINAAGTQFPDTCACDVLQDNGAGLSWALTVPANGSVSRSLITTFSPTGIVITNPQTLTVNKAGTGTGTVTGTGINCGVDCTEIYEDGTSVTLTATPANGSAFAGWSGCDNPSGNTCTMSMTANKTVTANFTAVPVCPTVPASAVAFQPRQPRQPTVPGVRAKITVAQPSQLSIAASLEWTQGGKKRHADLGTFSKQSLGTNKIRIPLPKKLRDDLPLGAKVTLKLTITATPFSGSTCAKPTVSNATVKTRVVHVLPVSKQPQ